MNPNQLRPFSFEEATAGNPFDQFDDPKSSSAMKPFLFEEVSGQSSPGVMRSVTDAGRVAASGALQATGSIFEGGGQILADALNAAFQPDTPFRAENPLANAAESVQAGVHPANREAMALSTPSGDITKPETWQFGDDPSLRGYALQTANAVGQFIPNLGAAIATGGASIPAQVATGAALGGLQAFGAAGDEEVKRLAAIPHEQLLAESDVYRQLIGEGLSIGTARDITIKRARQGGGIGNAAPSALEGAAENVLIGALTRGKLRMPGNSLAAKITTGAAGGAVLGGTEEAIEQAGQNLGYNLAVGGQRTPTEDTFGQFVLGALGEGIVGGGGGAVSHLVSGNRPGAENDSAPVLPANPQEVSLAGAAATSILTGAHARVQARKQADLERAATLPDVQEQSIEQNRGIAATPLPQDEAIATTDPQTALPLGEATRNEVGSTPAAESPHVDQMRTVIGEAGKIPLSRDWVMQIAKQTRDSGVTREALRDMSALQDFMTHAENQGENTLARVYSVLPQIAALQAPDTSPQAKAEALSTIRTQLAPVFDFARSHASTKKLPQIASQEKASFVASKQAEKTGTPYAVIPHPVNSDHFAVVTEAEARFYKPAAHQAATSPNNDLPQPTQQQNEAGNLATAKAKVQFGQAMQQAEASAKLERETAAAEKLAIPDFGEKLGGARKDKAAELRDAISKEFTDEEIASQPLSKIWPKDSIAQIEDPFIAAVAHAARAEIPTKPRHPHYVKGWIEKVKTVRGLTNHILDGRIAKEQFTEKLRGNRGLEHFAAKVSLLEGIDRSQWDRIGKVEEHPQAFTYGKDGKTQIPTPLVTVYIDDKRMRYEARSVAEVLDKVRAALGEAPQAKKMEFEVRGQSGRYFINKKGDKLYRKLKSFDTSKEALDYRQAHHDELVVAWEAVKDSDNVKETDVRGKENRPRTAQDWRRGKDVTADRFSSEFGFRGVEFGNWVAQGSGGKDRQGMLNQAYDALMDLADIVGVQPKAMSLNGTLGLGFGSRGAGKFAAHFEPDMLVINLTKTRGAGSLAHEWFHALDNYFQSQRGKGTDFITNNPENYYIHKQNGFKLPARAFENMIEGERHEEYGIIAQRYRDRSQWELKEGVRTEVAEAFAALVKALNDSPMAARASLIDKGKSGGYWSRIIERGARSFENHIIHKMMLKGYHNDYLANVVAVADFKRDPGRYPYLLENEVQPVAEAFDKLFATIQTKETAKGVAMFQKGRSAPSRLGDVEFHDAVAGIVKNRNVGAMGIVPTRFSGLPQAVQAEAKRQGYQPDEVRGVFHDGKVYVVHDGISHAAQVEEVVFHELYHRWIRGALGTDAQEELNAIFNRIGGGASLLSLANKHGWKEARGIIESYLRRKDLSREQKLAIITEELLAHIGQQNANPGLAWKLKEFVGAIRQWLRDHGFARLAAMSETDIAHLLKMARQTAGKAEGGSPAFMVSKHDSTRDQNKFTPDGARSVFQTIEKLNIQDVKASGTNFTKGLRGVALGVLGRRQIVDIYGEELPHLTRYSNMMQRMDAEKSALSAEADKIAERWGKLPRPVADKLADVMHEATLAGFDPDVGEANNPEQARLLRDFKELPAVAQGIYRDARDAYRAHWNAVKLAIGQRIDRAEIDEKQRQALKERVRDEFTKAMQGIYFPLARFGDYTITVKDKAGGQVEFVMAETLNQAEAERARLVSQYPSHQVSQIGKRKEYNAATDSVSRDFVTDLFSAIDKTTDQRTAGALKDAVNQLYLHTIPGLSWARSGIHRKGMPGYSNDARRAFASHLFHGGFYLAKLRYADRLAKELEAMQAHVDANRYTPGFDAVKSQDVVNEMVKRHAEAMNPRNSDLANALTGAGFFWYLGLSPASAIVNLTQTPLIAFPMMGAKWGVKTSASALLTASREAAMNQNDMSKVLNADERKAFDQAVKDGLIDITLSNDLAGVASASGERLSGKMQPVMKWASYLFHHAEKFNRQATFIAAYRLSKKAGKTHVEAFKEARQITYDAHFDYSANNRARYLQGPVQRVLFLFQQYNLNMLYVLIRNAIKAAQGDKEARQALSGILAMHAMTAGVFGLPVVGTLMAIASMIGGSDDEPWDAKVALRNYLAEAVGKDAAEVIVHGLPRAILPGDLANRVGLNSLLFHDSNESLQGVRWYQAAMTSALGPVAGIGLNFARGAQTVAEGKIMRGIEEMLPKFLKDAMKAVRYAEEGVIDKTGVPVLHETSTLDEITQALGFTPSRVAESWEGRSAIANAEQRLMRRRHDLINRQAKAIRERDQETLRDNMTDILKFNQANPTHRITQQNVMYSVRASLRRTLEERNGVFLPRRHRGLASLGEFANAGE